MKPILLTGEMVRSTLAGLKTKTRRPLKPQPEGPPEGWYADAYNHSDRWCFWGPRGTKDSGRCTLPLFKCPFGQVGDRLWVRETWYPAFSRVEYDNGCVYKADYGVRLDLVNEFYPHPPKKRGGWNPSIHMPRWASRITLEITDIRIELVQEITEEEATAEGFFPHDGMTAVYRFSEAWDSLYAKKGLGVDVNPWVWVLTFRRVEG